MSSTYLKDPRAGTFEGWIAALTILAKYNGGMTSHLSSGAEHDILYLPDKPEPTNLDELGVDALGEPIFEWENEVVKADVAVLDALGFHYDEDIECWAKFT